MVFELEKCIVCDREFCQGSFWTKVRQDGQGDIMEYMFCNDECFKKSGYKLVHRNEYRTCLKCDRVSIKCVFGGATDQELTTLRAYPSLVQTQLNECGHEERWVYSRKSGCKPDVLMVKVISVCKKQ